MMNNKVVYIPALILLIGIVLFVFLSTKQDELDEQIINSATNTYTQQQETNVQLSEADLAGKQLSNNNCEGIDKPLLTNLPMKMDDFSMIIPYGLMVGGHVTPIDHQYFSPKDYNSPIDAYEVYAMADANIVAISTRDRMDKNENPFQEYRIVFSISCRLFYYYDLVTSLAPDILAVYKRDGNAIDHPVQAGDLLGHIGGQTLDFAVWDTEKPLTGFLVPEHYIAESWKLYTADPLNYYTDELKAKALSKYIRTTEPRSGKIDNDVEGKLIGNWFVEGTHGYAGGGVASDYWTSHLAFAPDHIDPSGVVVSIGNWPGGASQFAVVGNTPDPANVGVETGLIKYSLTDIQYADPDGFWDRLSLVTPITFNAGLSMRGCFLAELAENQRLKTEIFKDTLCASVFGFTNSAIMYTR